MSGVDLKTRGLSGFRICFGEKEKLRVGFGLHEPDKLIIGWYIFSSDPYTGDAANCKSDKKSPGIARFASDGTVGTNHFFDPAIGVDQLTHGLVGHPMLSIEFGIECKLFLQVKGQKLFHIAFHLQEDDAPPSPPKGAKTIDGSKVFTGKLAALGTSGFAKISDYDTTFAAGPQDTASTATMNGWSL